MNKTPQDDLVKNYIEVCTRLGESSHLNMEEKNKLKYISINLNALVQNNWNKKSMKKFILDQINEVVNYYEIKNVVNKNPFLKGKQ